MPTPPHVKLARHPLATHILSVAPGQQPKLTPSSQCLAGMELSERRATNFEQSIYIYIRVLFGSSAASRGWPDAHAEHVWSPKSLIPQ